jgi:hypothetical protein
MQWIPTGIVFVLGWKNEKKKERIKMKGSRRLERKIKAQRRKYKQKGFMRTEGNVKLSQKEINIFFFLGGGGLWG